MSKRLFNDANIDDIYAPVDSLNPDGGAVAHAIDLEILAIADRLCKEGYNMRDVESLMHYAVSMSVARSIFDKRRRERAKRIEETGKMEP